MSCTYCGDSGKLPVIGFEPVKVIENAECPFYAPNQALKDKYQEMADFTRPRCGACPVPNHCCAENYCESTREYARDEWSVTLIPIEGAKLPYLGPKGCIVSPYLRPICTVHVCDGHLMKDATFAEKYEELREELNVMEFERVT